MIAQVVDDQGGFKGAVENSVILGCLGCRTKTLRRKYSEVAWSVVEEETERVLDVCGVFLGK